MKWHDYIFSFLLITAIILVFMKMEFYSTWLTTHGEEIIRIQKDIKMVFNETTYNRIKYKAIQEEIQRVIKQNEAFEEAYYLIKEELDETKIQKRKRN